MTNIPLITVFTPTFNRQHTLGRVYESLKKQLSKNFIWLIIDDGSTDNTSELVNEWLSEDNSFQIKYIYKSNGGLHTTYNTAIEKAETELIMCIDSDDWLPENAIEKIENIWNAIDKNAYVGIMGIDTYSNSDCVGDYFPTNIKEMFLYEKLVKYNICGDKKMIQKTSLLKQVAPMPTFNNEKNFNPSYMMYQLDKFGKHYITNDCFCIVEYQEDGMSSNIYREYKRNPNSFLETRKLYLSFPDITFKFKLKQYVHYVSSAILSKRFFSELKHSENKFLFLLSLFFAIPLSIVIITKG